MPKRNIAVMRGSAFGPMNTGSLIAPKAGQAYGARFFVYLSGSGTHNVTAGTVAVDLFALGPGGKGGRATADAVGGAGGGGGGRAKKHIASPAASYPYSIGAADSETATTVGTLTANAGTNAVDNSPGTGGTATGGDTNSTGGNGGTPNNAGVTPTGGNTAGAAGTANGGYQGGGGGGGGFPYGDASILGGILSNILGGVGGAGANAPGAGVPGAVGNPATGYGNGGGGGGTGNTNANGGSGSGGLVIVIEYYLL